MWACPLGTIQVESGNHNDSTREGKTVTVGPFEVGEQYANRRGEYKVLEILGNGQMRVVYTESGETATLDMGIQNRIWSNLQIEQRIEAERPARASRSQGGRRRGPRDTRGRRFDSLAISDFKDNVRGTNWRQKVTLAGLLARRLSTSTKRDFQHKPVPRQPVVLLYMPKRAGDAGTTEIGKFVFRLDANAAYYGFYIERPEHPIDEKWDWKQFLEALSSRSLTATLEETMGDDDLRWEIWLTPDNGERTLEATVTWEENQLLWQEEATEAEESLTWEAFADRLADLDKDVWCDIYLWTDTPKGEAIALGRHIAEAASSVYVNLIPLYDAVTEN
jgi:hypothetical protein